MAKVKGNRRVRLSLRGAHRGEALQARQEKYDSAKMSDMEKRAWRKPGSNKKS